LLPLEFFPYESHQIEDFLAGKLVPKLRHAIAAVSNLFDEFFVLMMKRMAFAQAGNFQLGAVVEFHRTASSSFSVTCRAVLLKVCPRCRKFVSETIRRSGG